MRIQASWCLFKVLIAQGLLATWSLQIPVFTQLLSASTFTPRYNHAAAACGDHTLILGGVTGESINGDSQVHAFDGNHWTRLADAPWSGRESFSAISVGVGNQSSVLIAGGHGRDAYDYRDVWVLHCHSTNFTASPPQWSRNTDQAPWPVRHSHNAVLWRNEMVILGGYSYAFYGMYLNDCWTAGVDSLNSTTPAVWTQQATASWTPRDNFAAGVILDALFVTGGSGSITDEIGIWRLDDWSQPWQLLSPAYNYKRTAMGFTVLDNNLVVIAGRNSTDYNNYNAYPWTQSNDILFFDGAEWSISTLHAPFIGRSSAKLVSTPSFLILCGGLVGEDGHTQRSNDCWWTGTSSGTIIPTAVPIAIDAFQPSANALFKPRQWQAAATCNNNIIVMGGNDQAAYVSDHGFFNGTAWGSLIVPWSYRWSFPAVSSSDGRWILIAGGANTGGKMNDIWSMRCPNSDLFQAPPVWTRATAAAPWTKRYRHGAVLWRGNFVLLGGYDYESRNDVWSAIGTELAESDGTVDVHWVQWPTAPWSPRESFAVGVMNDALYVAGGSSQAAVMGDIWYLGDPSQIWTQLFPALTYRRTGMAFSVIANHLVCAGGGNTNDVMAFNGTQWTIFSAQSFPGRSYASLVALNQTLFLIAGSQSYTLFNDVWTASWRVDSSSSLPDASDSSSGGALVPGWSSSSPSITFTSSSSSSGANEQFESSSTAESEQFQSSTLSETGTYANSSSGSSSSIQSGSTGAVVDGGDNVTHGQTNLIGAVVGVIGGVLVIVCLFWWWYRVRYSRQHLAHSQRHSILCDDPEPVSLNGSHESQKFSRLDENTIGLELMPVTFVPVMGSESTGLGNESTNELALLPDSSEADRHNEV